MTLEAEARTRLTRLSVVTDTAIAAYRDAILAAERERMAALVAAAREILAHTSELEDAWRSGAITEHDGRGGSRSNRNVDVDRKLRTALRAYEEGAK